MNKLSKRITSSAMNFGKFMSLMALMMTVISSDSNAGVVLVLGAFPATIEDLDHAMNTIVHRVTAAARTVIVM